MRSCGVPVIPGSDDVINEVVEAKILAEKLGYPIMIKASAGGGGKGMRLVKSQDGLESAFSAAQAEAKNAFNNGDLYLEKFIDNPRHIEVQILADNSGNTIHLGERAYTSRNCIARQGPAELATGDRFRHPGLGSRWCCPRHLLGREKRRAGLRRTWDVRSGR